MRRLASSDFLTTVRGPPLKSVRGLSDSPATENRRPLLGLYPAGKSTGSALCGPLAGSTSPSSVPLAPPSSVSPSTSSSLYVSSSPEPVEDRALRTTGCLLGAGADAGCLGGWEGGFLLDVLVVVGGEGSEVGAVVLLAEALRLDAEEVRVGIVVVDELKLTLYFSLGLSCNFSLSTSFSCLYLSIIFCCLINSTRPSRRSLFKNIKFIKSSYRITQFITYLSVVDRTSLTLF